MLSFGTAAPTWCNDGCCRHEPDQHFVRGGRKPLKRPDDHRPLYLDAPCLRSTSATVAPPLRSMSFCPIIITGEVVTGMRLGFTFCGMREPVMTDFSPDSDFFF